MATESRRRQLGPQPPDKGYAGLRGGPSPPVTASRFSAGSQSRFARRPPPQSYTEGRPGPATRPTMSGQGATVQLAAASPSVGQQPSVPSTSALAVGSQPFYSESGELLIRKNVRSRDDQASFDLLKENKPLDLGALASGHLKDISSKSNDEPVRPSLGSLAVHHGQSRPPPGLYIGPLASDLPRPAGLSLGALAGEHLKADTPLPTLSLGALAGEHLKAAPTTLSLGSLASEHLKAPPPTLSLGSLAGEHLKAPPPTLSLGSLASEHLKATSAGGNSLCALANEHLKTTGLSLGSLASEHLKSTTPSLSLGSLASEHLKLTAGSSLGSIAGSQEKQALGFRPGSLATAAGPPGGLGALANLHLTDAAQSRGPQGNLSQLEHGLSR